MSVLSKYIQVALTPVTCKDIVHPHTDSCLKAALGYFFKPLLTTVQFFIPLFMISIAAKKDKFDRDAVTDMLKNLVGAVTASLLTGSIGTTFMCGLYNILKRFHWWTIVGVPGFIGAFSIFSVPNQIAIMFTHSALVMVTQVMIKRQGDIFFKCLDRTIWFRTFVFMLLSAITLDSLRKFKPEISWFIQPVRRRSKRRYENYDESSVMDKIAPISGNVCSHKKSCDQFILHEFKTYFKIGIAIELVQNVLRHFNDLKRNVFSGILTIIKRFNWKFILFAVGYPVGYRMFACLFNRFYGFESRLANCLASFLAGGFFYFHPELSFLSYGMACTIEIVWQRLRRNKSRKLAIIRKIDELPLARIFYPILMGFLFHMRSFYPWQVPTLLLKVMSFVTCKHDEQMLMNCYSFLMPSYT